ncbi:MAG: hypothetical protein WEB52_09460 [Dehalococcoidia bacterium]
MLDTSFVFAPHLFMALAADRDRVAESRKWLRSLREFESRDREAAAKTRNVIICKPAHLAGPHKL